jgi:hypothetical protein
MTDQHRATPEQWAKCEEDARLWSGALNCILELRARVEALEVAQRYQFRSATEKVPTTRLYSYSVGLAKPLDELGQGHTLVSPEPASAEAQPGGLVEGVAAAIDRAPFDEGLHQWDEASAAICAVATWLDRFALHGSGEYAQAAKVLRQEVGRG